MPYISSTFARQLGRSFRVFKKLEKLVLEWRVEGEPHIPTSFHRMWRETFYKNNFPCLVDLRLEGWMIASVDDITTALLPFLIRHKDTMRFFSLVVEGATIDGSHGLLAENNGLPPLKEFLFSLRDNM